MGPSYDSITRLMLQNGSDYNLLEEETRDYVFYPAVHLLADSLPHMGAPRNRRIYDH